MQSSLIFHVKLSLKSAAIYAGTTQGELYQWYDNHPPDYVPLADLHRFAGDKIKANEHNAAWFNSPAAEKDPLLSHTIDQLLDIMNISEICDDFRTLLPPKPTIGNTIETLRIIVNKYEKYTGTLYDCVEQLSYKDFFAIT